MHSIVKGSLFAIAAFFSMAIFGILTKIASITGDPVIISFVTYLVGFLITLALFIKNKRYDIKSNHYYGLIGRAVIGTAASFLYMISMHTIPVVNATLLFNTAPVFIPILSVIWLKDKINQTVWLAVVLGFIGIVIIIKPSTNLFNDPGNLIGLASGFALAIAYLLTKLLTKTETSLRIIFYYLGIGTLIQLPLLFFTQHHFTIDTILYAALCGLFLFLAQVGLIKAYTYASAAEVGIYQYTSVVFVGLIEWIVWSRTPDHWDIVGIFLVSLAGIIIIHAGVKK